MLGLVRVAVGGLLNFVNAASEQAVSPAAVHRIGRRKRMGGLHSGRNHGLSGESGVEYEMYRICLLDNRRRCRPSEGGRYGRRHRVFVATGFFVTHPYSERASVMKSTIARTCPRRVFWGW